MIRALYSLLIVALLPIAALYLLWRSRKQAEYRAHWDERFACYRKGTPPAAQAPDSPSLTVWLHAVSVGETRAAQPIIAALRSRYPDVRIVLTHTTPTGRATSEALYGDQVERLYLPYDTPWAVRRFLRRIRPQIGLIMETEVWPNLLHEAARARIPTLLVNARLSARSAAGYGRFAALTRTTLACLSAVGAQAASDAQRLRDLGAHSVTVTGNLKFDITAPPALVELGKSLKQRFGQRQVFLCASTREGEEALLLSAWRAALADKSQATLAKALLLIVPRHPQRFNEVAALAAQLGFTVQRRSTLGESLESDTQVLIGDSMGEMFAYYAASDLAFVGGSLMDFGCQNLIEPCSVGTPVLIGPSTFNFAEAAAAALASQAAQQVASADDLIGLAGRLLADPARLQALSVAGLAFADAHRGATRRTMTLIDEALR